MTTRLLSTLLAAALLVAAFTAISAPSASAATAGKCTDKAKGVTVLVRTKTAVVFQRKARTGSLKGQQVAFACLYKKGANVLLGENGFEASIEKPALAGPYVGYGQSFCFGVEDTCGVTIKVVDLRSGKVVRKAGAYSAPEDVSLRALVLSPKGFAGWIAANFTEDGDETADEVHVLDSAGARRVDSGAKISTRSFVLKGSTLSWQNGAETRTATLS